MTHSETEDLISQKKKVDKLEKKDKKTKKSKKKDSANEEEAKKEKLERKEAKREKLKRKEAKRENLERKEAKREKLERKEAKRENLERKEAKREKLERKEAKRKKLERIEVNTSKGTASDQVACQQEEGSLEEVKEEEGAQVERDQVKDQPANKTLQGQVQQDQDSDGEDHQAEIKEQKKSKQKKSKRKSDTIAQGTTDTKRMEKMVEIPPGWVPIRHPKLPDTASPLYFVNKDGNAVYSIASRKLEPIRPLKRFAALGPRYNIGRQTIKLEEIMAHSFLEDFDSSKHYIFHKDGQLENCAWNNLIVCYDLPTLQMHEIARLQKQYPDAKYTVIRNVHETSTFEHYLISDTGNIYSLIERRHIHLLQCSSTGYLKARLSTDIGITQATGQSHNLTVHTAVMQSFNNNRPKGRVFHINGNCFDNALTNLTCIKSRAQTLEKEQMPVDKQARSPQGIMPLPFPPITDSMKWKTIGVLPWDGQPYSQYEVSDMGHVRRKDTSEMIPFFVGKYGHVYVSIRKDCQGPKKHASSRSVARLVAYAFVDGYISKRDLIEHLNGDQHDNRALNLRWVHQEKKVKHTVVVSLVDNPEIQRVFSSASCAQRELHVTNLKKSIDKCGGTFTREIDWSGEKKLVQFRLLVSE